MAGSDRIGSHILHDGKLTIHSIIGSRASKRPLVMMQADSIQFQILSIQFKTITTIETIISESECRITAVHQCIICPDFCPDKIQVRILCRPKRRGTDRHITCYSHGISLLYGCCSFHCVRHHVARLRIYSIFYQNLGYINIIRSTGIIYNIRLDMNRAYALFNIRCSHLRSPVIHI